MKTTSSLRFFLPTCLFILCMGLPFSALAQNETLNYSKADNDLIIAKATVAAYEAQNWEQLRGYLDPDANIFGLASFDSLNVNQTLAYWHKGSEAASPDLTNESWLAVSFSEGTRKGNWVYNWGTNTLTYTSGEQISFPYHIALKISNGKVAEAHFYYDNYKIIRGMGYAISPPLEEDSLEEGIDISAEKTAEKN